jgi:integron integrase
LSLRTEDRFVDVIRHFILFHGKKHPAKLGAPEIREYLTCLAVERNVAASTQNVALNTLVFLYRDVLKTELAGTLDGFEHAKRPARLPTIFTRAEVQAVLSHLTGTQYLMAALLYGAGLRLMEFVRLRVKDMDLSLGQITVCEGKGDKDRMTMLPAALDTSLREQLARARKLYDADLRAAHANVFLPHALAQKYPDAPRQWAWQWVFPADRLSVDPRAGALRRHHIGISARTRSSGP